MKSKIQHHWRTICFVLVGLLIAGFLHGFNMFHYPYYENDEGVYVSQGYAIGFQGKVADYTYWYDHIPGGWVLIATWLRLTGGPFTFGFSLYSGRIFMLVIHLFSSAFIFIITKRLTGKNWPAFLAMILFSLTPIGAYFHRRVLLDNIMTFWTLASLVLVLLSKHRLRWIAAGGVCAAFAVLSKETAIVTIPPLLLLSLWQLKPRQRIIGALLFLLPVGLGIGYFFLYALLKQEFFPGPGHVSLVGTWAFQLSRGNKVPFWNPLSDFWSSLVDWMGKDPWFVVTMILSLVWMLISSWKNRERLGVALVALSFWLFMMRGSLVLNFYVIPMIAFGAITAAVSFFDLSRLSSGGRALMIIAFLSWSFFLSDRPWITDETTPQLQSIDWIKHNLPQQSIIAMDHFELLDMQQPRFADDPVFPKAHWFWKLQDDPTISEGVIDGDWQNIDYLVLTHEFIRQLGVRALPLLTPVLQHSREVASWGPLSPQTYLEIDKLISTNGDWVKVYRVMDRSTIVLFDAWQAYVEHFMSHDGKVFDPQTQLTTSEGQSYAMLRAVAMGDRDRFDSAWLWAKNHFQFRQHDKLLSWKWEGDELTGRQTDSNSAADADIDIATALLLAHQTWNDPQYLAQAQEIIKDIWLHEVVRLDDGRYVLTAGSWAVDGSTVTINPSYFSPASYRLFAEVDPQHPWNRLATDSYSVLEQTTKLSDVGLPPDWAEINTQTGGVSRSRLADKSADFGYDAVRVFFRISEDALWFETPAAMEFLHNHQFLIEYWKTHQMIPAGFTAAGEPTVDFENNSFYGSLLAYVKIVESDQYESMKNSMMRGYKDGQWGPAGNYYVQNWAWMGYALAEGKMNYAK